MRPRNLRALPMSESGLRVSVSSSLLRGDWPEQQHSMLRSSVSGPLPALHSLPPRQGGRLPGALRPVQHPLATWVELLPPRRRPATLLPRPVKKPQNRRVHVVNSLPGSTIGEPSCDPHARLAQTFIA